MSEPLSFSIGNFKLAQCVRREIIYKTKGGHEHDIYFCPLRLDNCQWLSFQSCNYGFLFRSITGPQNTSISTLYPPPALQHILKLQSFAQTPLTKEISEFTARMIYSKTMHYNNFSDYMFRLPSVTISFVFIQICVSDENLPNDERRKSTNKGSYFDFNIRKIWDYITSSGTSVKI